MESKNIIMVSFQYYLLGAIDLKRSILGFNENISIIILSSLILLFSIIGGYQLVTNMISFVFVVIKYIVFIIVPLFIYLMENNQVNLKKIAGIYASYFIVNLLLMILSSFFVGSLVTYFIRLFSDLIHLIILLSSLALLIEGILEYNQIKSKIYSSTIVKVVYMVGDLVSYPILKSISKYITKK